MDAPEAGGAGRPVIPGCSAIASKLLHARGFAGDAAGDFLRPRMSQMHDPALLPGLERAAERLLAAITRGDKVIVYGDYDVDGVTASTILARVCKAISPDADLSVYIPHRVDEGYGLNADAITSLCDDGASLIVSVDCGVTAVGPAAVARARGVDLIITDHHNLPQGDLPDCYAVVHPRLQGSAYPFGELCGAGVAFKLAWRVATMAAGSDRVSEQMRETLLDMLALAALGTIADIVPLVGENRVIARFGLSRLKSTSIAGLHALIEASGLAGERVTAEDVGFKLGPRLNACGRMGHAREASELLLTDSRERADEIAAELTRLNQSRQSTERRIFGQAMEMAESGGMFCDDCRAVVLAHEDWHTGVVGIVCSRLVEKRRRPTILMQRDNGLCSGSGRSVDGVSLHAALQECADLLETFGGHDMAAGLRVKTRNLDAFTERFTGVINGMHPVDGLIPELRIDCDAALEDLSPAAVRELESLAPCGRDNPVPVLLVPGLRVAEPPRAIGAHAKHLSLLCSQGNRSIRLVGWGWGERIDRIAAGMTLDAAIEVKMSAWHAHRGRDLVEGVIRDLRPHGS